MEFARLKELYTSDYISELMDYIRSGKDIEEFIENRNSKLRDEYYQTNNKAKLDAIKNYEAELLNCTDDELKRAYEQRIEKAKNSIEKSMLTYDSPEYVAAREEKNNILREFFNEKGDAIRNAPQVPSKEEVATKGLSAKYIEQEVLQSNRPGEVMASIRHFYEGLDRPAAPMVAFRKRSAADSQGHDAQEDIIAKLREKGFDAVKSSDPRAKDPNVFVVEPDCVHAPFMEPSEALKANIQIIEAIYDSPAVSSTHLSNPMTREAFVQAIDKEQSFNMDLKEISKVNGCDLNGILSRHYDDMTENNSYENLYDLVYNSTMKQDNNELFSKLDKEIRNKCQGLMQSGQWNNDSANNMAKQMLSDYRENLEQYLTIDKYLQDMSKDALNSGVDPKIFDQENLSTIEQGHVKKIYHSGKCSDPYAVLCSENNMNFIYAAASLTGDIDITVDGNTQRSAGSIMYAFGASTHNNRELAVGACRIGFICEYESRGEDQDFSGIDRGGAIYDLSEGKFDPKQINGANDETAVVPHQNKLTRMFIAIQDEHNNRTVIPLELNDKGEIIDKKWRDFCDLNRPVNDNLKGYMIERNNNMIANYDATHKEQVKETIKSDDKVKTDNVASEIKTPQEATKQTEQAQPQVQQSTMEANQPNQSQTQPQSATATVQPQTVQQESQVQQTQMDNQPKVFQYTPYTTPHIVQEQPQPQQTQPQPQIQQSAMETAQPQVQQTPVANDKSAQYDQFVSTNADAKLRAACTDMLNKEPGKYSKIVSDWTAQYNADPMHPEKAVNNVLATYKNDLMPYVEPMMKAEKENQAGQQTQQGVAKQTEQQTPQAQPQLQIQQPIKETTQKQGQQPDTQTKSLQGQKYAELPKADKKTFVMALRKGDNLISGEGFKAATARVQSNQRQQTNSYAGKQTLQFGKMQSRDGRG